MSNRIYKLLGNSALFALGNLSSRLVTLIMIPVYTYYLTVAEYGQVDLIMSATSLLLPVLSLSVYEAVLRFTMENTTDSSRVFSNAFIVTVIGCLIFIAFYPILYQIKMFEGTLNFVYLILILQGFQILCSQFTRAIGLIKIYALNNILMAISMAFFGVMLLAFFDLGLKGYFYAFAIAESLSILHFVYYTKIYRSLNVKLLNKTTIKEMISYSVPLIPNSIMWWIINTSSRYLILFFVGVYANGLFALASKIPNILTMLYNVFFQAWQLSAIDEYKSKDNSAFFSKVYDYFSFTLLLGTSFLLVILKLLIGYTVSNEYFQSWTFVPFMLMGVYFANLAGFLGVNYLAAKKTTGVFKTSFISAVTNLILSLLLIPIIGALGASISTMMSFFIMWLIRYFDTKSIVNIRINAKKFILNLLVITLQILVLYFNLQVECELVSECILFIVLLLINVKLIAGIFNFCNSIINNKKKNR